MISVVVPCYRSEGTIKQCIDSILANDYIAEIIIVENGMQDSTRSLVELYPEEANVRYCFNQTANRALARNVGIEVAKSEYIAFVDSDVILDNQWSKNLLSTIESQCADGGQGRVYPYEQSCDTLACWLRHARLRVITNHTYIYLEHTGCDYPAIDTAACIYKRQHLLKVNGLDSSLKWHEDIDLSNRIYKLPATFVSCRTAVAYDQFVGGLFQLLLRNAKICFFKHSLLRKRNKHKLSIWNKCLAGIRFLFPPKEIESSWLQRAVYFFDGMICHVANISGFFVSIFVPRLLYQRNEK